MKRVFDLILVCIGLALAAPLIFQITGSYGVSGVEEMEARYRQGTLEEATSWRDLQRLDHLEYKQERLARLLKTLP